MKILVFDLDQGRLQQTARSLGEKYEVTPLHDDSKLIGMITDHHVVIVPEQINSIILGQWSRQFPGVAFLVSMERKAIPVIREMTLAGAKECIKYPITIEMIDRIMQEVSFSPIPEKVMTTGAEIQQVNEQQKTPHKKEQETIQKQSQTERKMPWDTEKRSQRPVRTETRAENPKEKREEGNPSWDEELQIPDVPNKRGAVPSRQEIIALTSARGGVGKSTVSYNMAALAASRGLRTAIIDADPKGNVASISQTKYRFTTEHWETVDKTVGENTVNDLLAKMTCGAYLLPSGSGREVQGVSGTTMAKIIEVLKRHFDLIIIDCEPRLTPATAISYQFASKILVVTNDDVSSFGRTIEMVNILQSPEGLELNPEKIYLVLNKVEKDFDPKAEEILIQKSGGRSVLAKLPFVTDLKKLQKQGRPIVANPKSSFTKQLTRALEQVILVPAVSMGSPNGLFAKLFKRA